MVSKVLPMSRAMYSVQMRGRWNCSEELDVGFEIFGPAVIVEGENVGLFDLDARDGGHGVEGGPVAMPEATGERLRGMRGAGPGKNLGQKFLNESLFIGDLAVGVRGSLPLSGSFQRSQARTRGSLAKAPMTPLT